MRWAGLLLHPTSLPGPFGSGDIGPAARRFLSFLEDAGQSLWQFLPLGPPSSFGSPYSSLSAFAGNPLLISPELLAEDGLLTADELDATRLPAIARVDYPTAERSRERLLRAAWRCFENGCFENAPPADLARRFEEFAAAPEQAGWLADWTLFAALRRRFDGRPWWEWPAELAGRERSALAAAERSERNEIAYQRFVQFLFFDQWERLRRAARGHGVALFSDLPIYLAGDAAEVWAQRQLFDLDEDGRPRGVAGVPPDYFSEDGQLWGNPLYDWPHHRADGYRWWVDRLAANLRLADLVRLDHFRAFHDYWAVPAGAATAEAGEWRQGPGDELFEALRDALDGRQLGWSAEQADRLPLLVAEDLGDLSPGVDELRRRLGLPGMRILQFGLTDPESEHAPHKLEPDSVVYTGTHDNDTAAGWYRAAAPDDRRRIELISGTSPGDIHRGLIRLAHTSVSRLAVVPVQDLLGLGSEARMNLPGTVEGNWQWRLTEGQLTPELAGWLRELTVITGRLGATGRLGEAPTEEAAGEVEAGERETESGSGSG